MQLWIAKAANYFKKTAEEIVRKQIDENIRIKSLESPAIKASGFSDELIKAIDKYLEPESDKDLLDILQGLQMCNNDLAADFFDKLTDEDIGINIRVVSMPSMSLFEENTDSYKEKLLPVGYKIFAIEYGSSSDWYKYVRNEKYLININNFGKSGTKDEILEYFELDYESVKNYIIDMLK